MNCEQRIADAPIGNARSRTPEKQTFPLAMTGKTSLDEPAHCFVSAALLGLQEFGKRDTLKYQMGTAAFVDNADVVVIDARQAGIARTATFIQQQAMSLGPSLPRIHADLDAVVGPALLRVWVCEEQ